MHKALIVPPYVIVVPLQISFKITAKCPSARIASSFGYILSNSFQMVALTPHVIISYSTLIQKRSTYLSGCIASSVVASCYHIIKTNKLTT